jgi:hypothetical protein
MEKEEMMEVFKGKFSTVAVDHLVAVGKATGNNGGGGIVTAFSNGCRNQTVYMVKEDLEKDYNSLVGAFKKANEAWVVFEGTFWVLRVDQVLEIAMDDKLGMYLTFKSGVREYTIYANDETRMREYTEMGLLMNNGPD